MQLGFATEGFSRAYDAEGRGVGDDEFSWGFDGIRQVLWPFKKTFGSLWKQGDVLGFACDMQTFHRSITLYTYAYMHLHML
jgi:hypothetical protein